MKHLFLHVGQHKTGTSSIQATLHDNRELLAGAGIHYLPDRANHSGLLRRAFAVNTRKFTQRPARPLDRVPGEELRQRFVTFLGQDMPGRYVISGEALELFGQEDLRGLVGFFRPMVDRITLVCFVRPPRSAIPSLAQQRLKAGQRLNGKLLTTCPHYDHILSSLAACADLAEQRIALHDRRELVRGCSVATFLGILGVPPELQERVSIRNVNHSLSRPAAVLLGAANAATPNARTIDARRRRLLLDVATRLPGPKFAVPGGVLDHVLCDARIRASVRHAEQALGPAFARLEAPLPSAPPSDSPTPSEWVRATLTSFSREEAEALHAELRAAAGQAAARPSRAARLDRAAAFLERKLRAAPSGPAPLLNLQDLRKLGASLVLPEKPPGERPGGRPDPTAPLRGRAMRTAGPRTTPEATDGS